jgi:hypothetical protein
MMHIYVFGSICRGEVTVGSDVDLLALVDGHDPRFDPDSFSIYSYQRIKELWYEGNPFAWHLSLESRLVFTSDKHDFIKSLGPPATYRNCISDCEKFHALFRDARASIMADEQSKVFDLSTLFLSVRNIATCYSLGLTDHPDFSRHSALRLPRARLPISNEAYTVLERARILCTRGFGASITQEETKLAIGELEDIERWMDGLVEEAKRNERVQ